MNNSTSKSSILVKAVVTIAFASALAMAPLARADERGKEKLGAAAEKTVTGEVVDMMCYVDHGAKGDKHAACAAKCIKGGGPVGIAAEGKTYLIVGDHKPMNDELADSAGKTITVKGKVAERDGINMIENAEIVKQ